MGKKMRATQPNGQDQDYEKFWVVTTTSGQCSPSLSDLPSVNDWILENCGEDLKSIRIQRKWKRKYNIPTQREEKLFNKFEKYLEEKKRKLNALEATSVPDKA